MLGLCCEETYGETTNHNKVEEDVDNNRNEDGNDDNNAASGSESDGPIFDPIVRPRSCLGISEEDWATTTTSLQPQRHVYLRVRIYLPYKFPINEILVLCHTLLYAKIGVLDL